MATKSINQITDVQDKVIETVQSFQEPIVSTVKRAAEVAEKYVPEVDTERLTESLPSARDLLDANHKFATKLLDANHKFVTSIIDAVEPVTNKVVKTAPAAKSTKKAA